jgi:hypothetical protein
MRTIAQLAALVLLIAACTTAAFGEERHELDIATDTTIIGANALSLPLWIESKRGGSVQADQTLQGSQGLEIDYHYRLNPLFGGFLSASGQGTASEDSRFALRHAYAGLRGGPFLLHAGWHPMLLGELPAPQLSTGSMAVSGNALPIPRVTLRTDDFIPLDFISPLLDTKFGISHGWFNDERYSADPFYHEKWFYLRAQEERTFSFHLGLVHMAMWAGENPQDNLIEPTFRNFVRIFMAQAGGSGASTRDQVNKAGQHFGIWDVGLTVSFDLLDFSAYHHHFFEDRRGGYWFRNGMDGLTGVSVELTDTEWPWPDTLLYERLETSYQTGPFHDLGGFGAPDIVLGGRDSYYMNGHYPSGWTHYGRIVGTPIFLTSGEGEDLRIGSNRVDAHHLGFSGSVADLFGYRYLFTTIAHRTPSYSPVTLFDETHWRYEHYLELSADPILEVERLSGSVGFGFSYGEPDEFDPSVGGLLKLRWELY